MSSSLKVSSQPVRVVFLFGYSGLLLLVSRLASGTWIPAADQYGLWFYSGLAALVLGDLIVTPLFVRPADTIAYAVSALCLFPGIRPHDSAPRDVLIWRFGAVLLIALLLSAIAAVALKDRAAPAQQRFGQALFAVSSTFGTATIVYSAVFVILLVLFHRHRPQELLVLPIGWMTVVVLRPFERIGALIARVTRLWRNAPARAEQIGCVVGHATPRMLLFRDDSGSLELGDAVLARDDAGLLCAAIVLDRVGFVDGRWNRAILAGPLAPSALGSELAQNGQLLAIHRLPSALAASVPGLEDEVKRVRERIVGVVAPGTDSERLLVDITNPTIPISEGQLLEATVSGTRTLFQVTKGTAAEEILREKNTRGYAVAEARKIGTWSKELGRFEKVNWLPAMNEPVELATYAPASFTGRSVGHFPGTGYTVSVDPHELVTHSATILGVLGSGKSYFGLELVERVLNAGCKVLCLDLTNQYAKELEPFYDHEVHVKIVEHLRKVGAAGRTKVEKNVEEGGSVKEFSSAVRRLAEKFLSQESERELLVFDPSEFEVWRQDSRPYGDSASMATLTPCEVTRVFADALLDAAKRLGMTKSARICLVLEEAHSLVPEWNAVASEGDRSATNGTARAILQGRKYGFGCLLVTQRTASVTKTILNQCNTVFALRAFDATGTEFLRNYFGDEYTSLLPSLEDRHAVVFGRASSCKAPVLVRLNNREEFIAAFRKNPRGAVQRSELLDQVSDVIESGP